jgi:hypothetical protein
MMSVNFFAIPPEFHSALLFNGPGPGSMIAAADAWSLLSAEYVSAADDLRATLATVQPSVWEGLSAERYIAAHRPYLIWLEENATDLAARAQCHYVVASAFSAALAAMPTPAELAVNRSAHTALISTNFLGINTIALAVNEAAYCRMWIQAATAMTAYDLTADVALQTMPRSSAAPPIIDFADANRLASPGADGAVSRASEVRVALDGSQSITSTLIEIIRFISPPLGEALEDLSSLDLRSFLALLATNPSAAIASVAPALGSYALWQSIGFMFWGAVLSPFLFLPPAIAIPIAIAQIEGKLEEPHWEVAPDRPVAPSTPAAEVARSQPALPASLSTISGPSPSSPPPSPSPSPSATPTGAPPANMVSAPYAFGIRPDDPDRDPGPRLVEDSEATASTPVTHTANTQMPVTDTAAARRRNRRRAKDDRLDRAHLHETMSATPAQEAMPASAQNDSQSGDLPSRQSAQGFVPIPADEVSGNPVRPLLPSTWTTPPSPPPA